MKSLNCKSNRKQGRSTTKYSLWTLD